MPSTGAPSGQQLTSLLNEGLRLAMHTVPTQNRADRIVMQTAMHAYT